MHLEALEPVTFFYEGICVKTKLLLLVQTPQIFVKGYIRKQYMSF